MRLFLSIILVFAWTSKGINAQNTANVANNSIAYKKAIILPSKNNKALLMNELASQRPGRPIQFAISDTLKANVYNSGEWTKTRGSKELWSLEIESKGAESLNLGFEKFRLPAETELTIYNKAKTYKLGPYTEKDNDDHLQLWTPIIKGDLIIIELHIPTAKKDELLLELNYINHDFMGFGKSFSGSCNLDVVCSEEDGYEMVDLYRDIIRSVGAYHINGNETCSGVLINNTRQDKRGYFLTAEHCGINNNNAASVVTYWNYQNSYCRLPNSPQSGLIGDGNLDQFNSGSILRARNANSDFCLIEFDDPIKPEYDPFYSGWDRNFQSTEMAICIHHPGVEEKRISFEFNAVEVGPGNYIEVADWDIGTTEGGSSGSPLYTKDKKIIGQLEGGLAACSNDLSDSYGSFAVSWFGSGTPATSLKTWLDPDNLDLNSIDGFEGTFGIEIANNFQKLCSLESDSLVVNFKVEDTFINFVNLEVEDIPAPLQLLNIEDNINPGSTSQLIFTNVSGMTAGEFSISIKSSDGTNTIENKFIFSIEDNVPNVLSPLLPINGFDEARNEQLLVWSEVQGSTYSLQVSIDPDFSELFYEEDDLDNFSLKLEELSNLTDYYWRVKASNKCGAGPWSEVFEFSTLITYCTKIKSEEFSTSISSGGPAEYKFNLFIDYPVLVDKLKVANVDLEHDYINDIDLELFNPETSESIVLLSQICDNEDDMNLGFDDNGINNLPCPPIDGTLYAPVDPLRTLKDINAQGLWELLVRDNFNFDGGIFHSWEIEVCFSETAGQALIPLNSGVIVCDNNNAEIKFYYNLNGESVNSIKVEDVGGVELPIEMIDLPLNDSGELKIQLADISLLQSGSNELYVVLNNTMEQVFYVERKALPEIQLDLSFTNGETIADLELIEWVGSLADYYTIEISNNQEFSDIEWFTNTLGNVDNIEGPTLDDGIYYLRIIADNECGSISSDLYNFSIDESVSLIESTKKPLLISQSLAGDEILISGNSDNSQFSLAVISISGHKLLSQSFNEASLLLDVSTFVPGVYLLELRSGKERTIRKVVVY